MKYTCACLDLQSDTLSILHLLRDQTSELGIFEIATVVFGIITGPIEAFLLNMNEAISKTNFRFP